MNCAQLYKDVVTTRSRQQQVAMLDAPFDLAKEAASLKEQQAVALELLRKSLEAEGLRRRAVVKERCALRRSKKRAYLLAAPPNGKGLAAGAPEVLAALGEVDAEELALLEKTDAGVAAES